MTVSKYISLYSALNMMDPGGNSGDWHPINLLPENLDFAGDGQEVDTRLWFQDKDIVIYPNHASLPEYCPSQDYWSDLPPPFIAANHQRAAVDLLYRDFFIWHKQGRTVDMYGWIDTDELIQNIFDDFQIIVDDLSTTSLKIEPATWRDYQRWIWQMAA
ncbi:MAG: hypothetical protein OXI88_09315 [Gammaproteobacteria bacterium]|nr:hypothetical protein [Gammaproteobacteria bacterium]